MKTILCGVLAAAGGLALARGAEAPTGAAARVTAPAPVRAARPAAPADLRTKVRTLVLPDLNFRNASLPEVTDFIVEQSRAADPEGVGVSIILKDDARGTLRSRRLTIGVKKPTLEYALRILSSAAGLLVRIDRSAIVIENDTDVIRRVPAR